MKKIRIADTTLCRENASFSFKEKIEIARQLEKLNVDIVELPAILNSKTDILLVRTISSFVKSAVLSVCAGLSEESVELAAAALQGAENPRIRIELPVSPVGMEYTCHKKPDKMLDWVKKIVAMAKENCKEVEFCALDATRADKAYVQQVVEAAVAAGADVVSVCDTAAGMMPDEFAAFASDIKEKISVPLGVKCYDKNGLAVAQAIMAARCAADCVKTSVGGEVVSLETFAGLIENCGRNYGFESNIRYTELNRNVKQIVWIADNSDKDHFIAPTVDSEVAAIKLDANDNQAAVSLAVAKLGYDLNAEDQAKVYEEFCRVAEKKNVGAKELDAIVASVALQVPSTYKLVSYVINNGNIISASAQITMSRGDEILRDICIGDGPIDAAFLAIDKIIGHHYELDDFQIQAVTEGKEAMGSALVKLRCNGKLYSGNGISTDIIGASIRAYINAVNKIVYEEA